MAAASPVAITIFQRAPAGARGVCDEMRSAVPTCATTPPGPGEMSTLAKAFAIANRLEAPARNAARKKSNPPPKTLVRVPVEGRRVGVARVEDRGDRGVRVCLAGERERERGAALDAGLVVLRDAEAAAVDLLAQVALAAERAGADLAARVVPAVVPVDVRAALVVGVDELVGQRAVEDGLVRHVLGDHEDLRRVVALARRVRGEAADHGHRLAARGHALDEGCERARVAAELLDGLDEELDPRVLRQGRVAQPQAPAQGHALLGRRRRVLRRRGVWRGCVLLRRFRVVALAPHELGGAAHWSKASRQ